MKKDIIAEARKRFERAKSFYSSSRQLAVDDTRFALGDSDNGYQWPDDIRLSRKLSKSVCLTVNTTAQHCNQIINEIRKNRPAVKVSPVDNGADKKTAEILAGLIRNIQVSSSADDAHDVAAEHAVYGGEGYWRVVTDYETPTSFDQVILIKPITNPSLVYIDPDCKELDKSDAQWGFVFDDVPKEQIEREYPDISPANWGDSARSNGWFDNNTVRIAEYFYCTYKNDTACLLGDGTTALKSQLPAGANVIETRPTKVKQWKWCKLIGGHDEPVDERDWLGEYLPIISVVGKEVNVNGEIIRKGIVRDLKDPARMQNYAYSETVQALALQNKTPYVAASEAIEGYENEWASANNQNKAYLPFNAYDDQGNPLPKPERQQPAVMPTAMVQLLQLSTEQMRAASGQQNANFGIKSEASSGVGIQRLKAQGEVATFHFPDNLSRALKYEAKVLIDLIQKYYDTRRVIRILGLDGKEQTAILNPEMPGAYHEQEDDAGEIQRIFNPMVGRYDVTIDTGPAYQTQRQEAFAALSEIAAKNPALMDKAGDLIMKAADFPMADELAERLEKMLPPELKEQKEGSGEIPLEVQAQMQQMQQQLQMLTQQLEQTGQALQQAQQAAQQNEAKAVADAQAKIAQSKIDQQTAIEKAMIDKETKIIVATIDAETEKEIAGMKREAESLISPMVEGEAPISQPRIVRKKTIQMVAPSGAVYTGVIQDEPLELETFAEPEMMAEEVANV